MTARTILLVTCMMNCLPGNGQQQWSAPFNHLKSYGGGGFTWCLLLPMMAVFREYSQEDKVGDVLRPLSILSAFRIWEETPEW